MKRRGSLAVSPLIAAVVFLALTALSAQAVELRGQPQGAVVRDRAEFAGFQFYLPPGEWLVTLVGDRGYDFNERSGYGQPSSRAAGMDTVRLSTALLVQLHGGVVHRIFHIETTLDPWPNNPRAPAPPFIGCAAPATVYLSKKEGDPYPRDSECIEVRLETIGDPAFGQLGQVPSDIDIGKWAFREIGAKKPPEIAIRTRFSSIRGRKHLMIENFYNPETDGIEPDGVAAARSNWAKPLLANDARRQAYVATIVAEAERLLPLMRDSAAGRLDIPAPSALSSVDAARPRDRASRLVDLHKLLDMSLIGREEYDLHRQRIFYGP